MSTDAPARYRRTSDGVHAVVLDGGVLAWDARSQMLHRLNESAAFVWQQCHRPASMDDIVAAAQARHAGGDALAADVERCVRELADAGLLELEAGVRG